MLRRFFPKKKHTLQVRMTMLVLLLALLVPVLSVSAPKAHAMDIPPQCASLNQEVIDENSTIQMLTDELNRAAGASEKSMLAHEIEAATAKLETEQAALDACLAANPLLPLVNATLTGSAFFSTTFDGASQHIVPLTIGLTFDPNTDSVFVPSAKLTLKVPKATITVEPTIPGMYNPATGVIDGAGASVDINAAGVDSTANVSFTTGSASSPSGFFQPSGLPVNPNGTTKTIVLVSASRFQGGILNGNDFAITVLGTLDQWP